MLEAIKHQIQTISKELEETLWEVAAFIHEHPEIGLEEFLAVERLTDLLETHGFTIERGIAGLETAFRASYELDGITRPTIAFIAEYDALPEIGHACGHNLIATISAGAGIVLSKLSKELQGRILVLGTPAEEGIGGKIPMVRRGTFDEIDAAMMVHPGDKDVKRRWNLAACMVDIEFRGKAAHAASEPHEGVNALDAMIHLFHTIGLLRQQVTADVRIHGIITHGGTAANVIPEYTRAQFIVRAAELSRMYAVLDQFNNCVKGAALVTGTQETIHINTERLYEPLLTNNVLMECYADNMRLLGVEVEEQSPFELGGSSDIGNVSQVVPAIHPTGSIVDGGQQLTCHSREFTIAAKTARAKLGMLRGIQALAMCGADLLGNPAVLEAVKHEFQQTSARRTSFPNTP
jgi:amidohydrolase